MVSSYWCIKLTVVTGSSYNERYGSKAPYNLYRERKPCVANWIISFCTSTLEICCGIIVDIGGSGNAPIDGMANSAQTALGWQGQGPSARQPVLVWNP